LLFVNKDKLLISGASYVIRVCDVCDIYSDCQCIKTFYVESVVNCLLLLPNGYFASNNGDKIKIWNLTNFEEVNSLQGHKDNIYSMLVLSDDKLVSASWDETIVIWGYD
jgi:WD40 repeat protein